MLSISRTHSPYLALLRVSLGMEMSVHLDVILIDTRWQLAKGEALQTPRCVHDEVHTLFDKRDYLSLHPHFY